MNDTVKKYAEDVAQVLGVSLGSNFTGAYIHGSAALGGFNPLRSDIDIIVVCERPMTPAEKREAAVAVSEEKIPCPARGLEMSIVTLDSVANPGAKPAFELHVTTATDDKKVVDGVGHGGDRDLVLHFWTCQMAGQLVGSGRPVAEVFPRVNPDLVISQLRFELCSMVDDEAPGEYSVLNACRAWRYVADSGACVSKIDGGLWALDRVSASDDNRRRLIIESALDQQRGQKGASEMELESVSHFLNEIIVHHIDG